MLRRMFKAEGSGRCDLFIRVIRAIRGLLQCSWPWLGCGRAPPASFDPKPFSNAGQRPQSNGVVNKPRYKMRASRAGCEPDTHQARIRSHAKAPSREEARPGSCRLGRPRPRLLGPQELVSSHVFSHDIGRPFSPRPADFSIRNPFYYKSLLPTLLISILL